MRIAFHLSTLMILLCLSTACKKNTVEPNVATPSRVDEVRRLDNSETQKVAFRLLSNAEKAELWHTHILQEIATGEYSSSQVALMKEALSFITADFFNTNAATLKSDQFATWQYKVSSIFSEKERALVFNSISRPSETQYASSRVKVNNEAPSTCECHSESDFCSNRDVTRPCYVTRHHCDVKYKCAFQGPTSGCGWMWSQSCDGECHEVVDAC